MLPNMTHSETLDLVGSSEAARILMVHPATVTRLVESDQLKPVGRLGGGSGAFIFKRADVDQLAEDRKPSTPAEPTASTSNSRNQF